MARLSDEQLDRDITLAAEAIVDGRKLNDVYVPAYLEILQELKEFRIKQKELAADLLNIPKEKR